MSDTAMSRPRCRAAACRPLRPRLSRRPKATEPFLLVIRKFRAVVRDIIPPWPPLRASPRHSFARPILPSCRGEASSRAVDVEKKRGNVKGG